MVHAPHSLFPYIFTMDFEAKKARILGEIARDLEVEDASPKGSIDFLCFPLINLINSYSDTVTTSSCSGRVSVFIEGDKAQGQIGAKGNGGHWLFVTHEKDKIPEWWKGLIHFDGDVSRDVPEKQNPAPQSSAPSRYTLFKFEPLIYHVQCRDFATASRLYSIAMGCGFRESGIGSNNNVAIRISIRLDAPIGVYDPNADCVRALVSESYLETLTALAYDRFVENERKTELLMERIGAELVHVTPAQHVETKEERRVRKMAEGLARREGVREEKARARAAKAALASQVSEASEAATYNL